MLYTKYINVNRNTTSNRAVDIGGVDAAEMVPVAPALEDGEACLDRWVILEFGEKVALSCLCFLALDTLGMFR